MGIDSSSKPNNSLTVNETCTMGMIVKTTYRVRSGQKASFLADFSVIANATRAAPACDWIYVVEDEEAETVEVMSCWQSEAGFDDHLRWRIETNLWRDIETKYIDGEPEFKMLPIMFRFA